MLKRLAIVASISALMAVCMSGQPNKAGNDKNGPPNKPQPPPPTVGAGSHDNYYNSYNAPAKSDDEPFRWHTAIKRPEWWAIGIAIGTLGLIYWQARETRRAAIATRDAAEAALLNAEALVNSERAWLVAVIRRNDKSGLFFIKIRNRGKTPARIIRLDSKAEFVPDDPENLIIPEDYQCPAILPNTTFIVDGFTIRPGIMPKAFIEQRGKASALDSAREFLVIYGRIVYEDVFPISGKPPNETRWCYVYLPAENRFMGGPERYTGNS